MIKMSKGELISVLEALFTDDHILSFSCPEIEENLVIPDENADDRT